MTLFTRTYNTSDDENLIYMYTNVFSTIIGYHWLKYVSYHTCINTYIFICKLRNYFENWVGSLFEFFKLRILNILLLDRIDDLLFIYIHTYINNQESWKHQTFTLGSNFVSLFLTFCVPVYLIICVHMYAVVWTTYMLHMLKHKKNYYKITLKNFIKIHLAQHI